MTQFAKFLLSEQGTTVYGVVESDGNTVIEKFATNPHCVGASEAQAGKVWRRQYSGYKPITQSEFNAAFLFVMETEMDEADKTMSLDELKAKYPEGENV